MERDALAASHLKMQDELFATKAALAELQEAMKGATIVANTAGQLLKERDAKIAASESIIVKLRASLTAIAQRANESGTGNSGLLETIHAMHGIARAALSQAEG